MRWKSIPVAPATIVRTKRSWPGTSTTETCRPPGSSRGANPSSIDMPRAFSWGRRSVSTPVSARTSAVLPWSMWPAVPSVRAAGCALTAVTARTARATSRASSSVSVRGSSSSRPSWMRPTTAGSPARSAAASASAPAGPGSIATAGPGQLEQRQRAAADARRRRDDRAAGRRRELVCAPAQRRVVGVEHRQHRQRAARGGRVAMQGEGRLERGERQLVDPHGARERMAAAGLDRGARSDQQPRLRAAEQLVARERGERGAGADRSAHRRLAGEQLEVVA